MEAHSAATRHLVLRLLNAGHTQAEVAKLAGVGTATVTRINRRQVRPRSVRKPTFSCPSEDSPPGYDPRQVRRCGGCGRQVYLWPCLACQLEGRCEIPEEIRPKRNHRARKSAD